MKKIAVVLSCLLVISGTVLPQSGVNDPNIKSVFIYTFTKYISWPEDDDIFKIGVLKADQRMVTALTEMARKKSTDARQITIEEYSNIDQIKDCEIVFIPASQSEAFFQLRDRNPRHTLIVTEREGLGSQGSGINFIEVEGRIKFEINRAAIEDTGLKIASTLMALGIRL